MEDPCSEDRPGHEDKEVSVSSGSAGGKWKRVALIFFFSLSLLILCVTIICVVCGYICSTWGRDQQIRSRQENFLRRSLEKDKANLEIRNKKLEQALENEKERAEFMVERERAESKARLREARLESEREKALLRSQNDYPVYYYDGYYYDRGRRRTHRRRRIYRSRTLR